MSALQYRAFAFETRASNEEKRELDVIASTGALDGHGEVLDLSDIDVTRYKKNPVVLYGHDSWGLPIGSAKNVDVKDGELHATLKLVDERAHPMAGRIWEGIKQGSLRGVSIGFRATKARTEKRGERDVIVRSGIELVEISIVPIPSNPEAVIHATRSMNGGTQMQTKKWEDMTIEERIAASGELLFKGKAWSELDDDEKAELWNTDHRRFERMKEGA